MTQFTVYVGSYADASAEAIHILRFDAMCGRLTYIRGVSNVANPSFLAVNRRGDRLYAVRETASGAVVAFSMEADGTVAALNSRLTNGSAPCYVSLDDSERWLYVANYMSGSVCLFPIEADGRVGPLADIHAHVGSGAVAARQDVAHTHTVRSEPWRQRQLVTDLGTDQIWTYSTDKQTGKLVPIQTLATPPGSGPRHLEFHPFLPVVYVTYELDAAIGVLRYDEATGSLRHQQKCSTLPKGFQGDNTTADLHISMNGQYLYVSNRGHDSVAIFQVGMQGDLSACGHESTAGRNPRNFALAPGGAWMLVANQSSNSVVVMKIGADGRPQYTGESARVAQPVCIQIPASSPQR